jgi:hypothetical protein
MLCFYKEARTRGVPLSLAQLNVGGNFVVLVKKCIDHSFILLLNKRRDFLQSPPIRNAPVQLRRVSFTPSEMETHTSQK